MSAIRPDLPVAQPVVSGPSAQVRAAQAAFFRAALSEVAPTSTTVANSLTSSTATKTDETVRLPRPGALLDIRV